MVDILFLSETKIDEFRGCTILSGQLSFAESG